jgi:outer membrane protein assembly factor BamD (BamD/ComL family)
MARPKSPPKRAAREPGEQLATVERAERALASGDAPEALRLVDEYDTKFPGGALLHEAAMVRIDALLKLGRPDEAATTADRFLAVHPASPYAAKLRRHLQSGSER